MKTVLVTVSDDRFGRKEGQYEKTQSLIPGILNNLEVEIDEYHMATWTQIENSEFYRQHSILLSNKDAAKNGRAYKPYVISEALKQIEDGDFLIYTDCSPEMWDEEQLGKGNYGYDLSVLRYLCTYNNGILTPFVKWDTRPIVGEALGTHTHANFTTDHCIDWMGMHQYEHSFMHASGMVVLQKNSLSKRFVSEWLYYNTIPQCACLGNPAVIDDYSYWDDFEDRYKMGHRHDQSISGLLVNEMNPKLIDPPPSHFHPYNFLNYCHPARKYKFIDSNTPVEKRKIIKGAEVMNSAGQVLRVFEIWPTPEGPEKYIVGLHRESAYQTTEDKLTVI